MSAITVFDIASTGLPAWGKPASDPSQPRAMQIAAIQFTRDAKIINRFSFYFQRDGWVATTGAKSKHEISERVNDLYGVPANIAMAALVSFARTSSVIASFGLKFDQFMAEVEMVRVGGVPNGYHRPRLREVCIKEAAAQAVSGGKAITLPDAHAALLGEACIQTYDANDDCEAAARIMFALINSGKLEI